MYSNSGAIKVVSSNCVVSGGGDEKKDLSALSTTTSQLQQQQQISARSRVDSFSSPAEQDQNRMPNSRGESHHHHHSHHSASANYATGPGGSSLAEKGDCLYGFLEHPY